MCHTDSQRVFEKVGAPGVADAPVPPLSVLRMPYTT